MRHWGGLCLLAAIGVLSLSLMLPSLALAMGASPDNHQAEPKPSAAFEVSISETGSSDGTVTLRVSLSVHAKTDTVSVEVRAAGGAEVVSGELEWTASSDAERTILVRPAKNSGGVIHATASSGKATAMFKQHARHKLGTPEKALEPDAPKGSPALDGQGRGIMEFPAR